MIMVCCGLRRSGTLNRRTAAAKIVERFNWTWITPLKEDGAVSPIPKVVTNEMRPMPIDTTTKALLLTRSMLAARR